MQHLTLDVSVTDLARAHVFELSRASFFHFNNLGVCSPCFANPIYYWGVLGLERQLSFFQAYIFSPLVSEE